MHVPNIIDFVETSCRTCHAKKEKEAKKPQPFQIEALSPKDLSYNGFGAEDSSMGDLNKDA